MRSRSGLTLGLGLGLPLVLIITLLVFVAVSSQDCGPAADSSVSANPVAVRNPGGAFTARVTSWNVRAANSDRRIIDGVLALTETSDVIGLQELSRSRRQEAVIRALRGVGWVMSNDRVRSQIAWRASRFTVLAQGSYEVFGVERIEDGASGTSIGPKNIQWVQLEDRQTGAGMSIINGHIVPTIERAGHPDTRSPRRLALADKQFAAGISLTQQLRPYGPVAWTGDFNVDARSDQRVKDPRFPYTKLGRAGLVSSWSELGMPSRGTHTHRLIDYVWLTKDSGRFVKHRILGKYGSDHSAVVAEIDKKAAGQAPAAPQTTAAPASQPLPASLTVHVGGSPVKLGAEQIGIAATVIAEGKALNIPTRGWIVALAAAGAESGIRNLNYGDRDSVGPWQMRPSTGWGTVEQIRNVKLAVRAFYGMAEHTSNPGLVDVDGWEQMTIAQAAQAVERSAFPDAYTRWEGAARTLVEQLGGVAAAAGDPAGADCPPGTAGLEGECPVTDLPAEAVLTPDGLLVLRCVKQQFPSITSIGTYRGHQPDQTRAVDIMIPGWESSSGKALGTQIAEWVKSHHSELGVQYVIWDGRIWNIERDREGWRPYFDAGSSDPNRAHRNHVHVSVYGDKGTGPAGSGPAQSGAWHTPIGEPSSVGCGFGCYAGHTGQDYPAATGTELYAVNGGTVVRSESITSSGTCSALPICGTNRVSYGNLVVIKLAGSDTTVWYAHLSARRVSVGQTVLSGQVIGAVGYEGNVRPKGPGGSHLHLEVRRGGTPINPLPFLRAKGVST